MAHPRILHRAIAVLAAIGCGSDPHDTPDSGPDGPTQCGADGLPCLTIAGGAPANYSCAPTAPVQGAPATLTLQATDDVTNAPGPGLAMELFTDGVLADTCTGSCMSQTTDASGMATVSVPTGMLAFRIASTGTTSSDTIVSSGYRLVRSNDTTKRIAFLTHGDVTNIDAMLGRSEVPGTSEFGGTIYDCDDQTVAGATIKLFIDGTEIVPGPAITDPYVMYFDRGSPAPGAMTTGVFGWYAAGNVPVPGAGAFRIEIYGTKTSGGKRELVGCEEGRVFAGGYSTRPIRPLRSDYGPGSGCIK